MHPDVQKIQLALQSQAKSILALNETVDCLTDRIRDPGVKLQLWYLQGELMATHRVFAEMNARVSAIQSLINRLGLYDRN